MRRRHDTAGRGRWRILAIALVLLLLGCPAGAVYAMDGVPLHTVAHGKHHGTVVVSGGHGLAAPPYSQSFTVPAGTVRFARLYVGVWGGTPEYRGTLDATLNGASLGTRPMDGGSDSGSLVYVSGFGVHWSAYDVTSRVKTGANTATATTAGEQFDGRVYGMVLAVATEDPSAPEVEYWFAEGNENLNAAAAKDSASLALGAGPAALVSAARLHVAYLASTKGDGDRLLFNGQEVATDAAGAGSGAYFDVRTYDVTPLARDSATIGFARGGATRLHPAFIGYVATLAAPTTPATTATTPSPSATTPLLTTATTAPTVTPETTATAAATATATTTIPAGTIAMGTTATTTTIATTATTATTATATTTATADGPTTASAGVTAAATTVPPPAGGMAVTPGAAAENGTGPVPASTANASAVLPPAAGAGAAPAGKGALEALAGAGGAVPGTAIVLSALVVAAGILAFSALAGGGLYAYRRIARCEMERDGDVPAAAPRAGRRYDDD